MADRSKQSRRWVVVLGGLLVVQASAFAKKPSSGFRLEGQPQFDTVFDGADAFQRYIDRFFETDKSMRRAHDDFSRQVRHVITTLGQQRRSRRKCPVQELGPSFVRIRQQVRRYQSSGKDLEASFVAIKRLERLGEAKALTPDYRWKVKQVFELYPRILQEFRELRVVYKRQLLQELAFYRCDLEELSRTEHEEPVLAVMESKASLALRHAPSGVAHASRAMFLVDNATCDKKLRIFLDGDEIGEAEANSRAAFWTFAGRHDLCLMQEGAKQECGQPGTVRNSYINDGWSIRLRCD